MRFSLLLVWLLGCAMHHRVESFEDGGTDVGLDTEPDTSTPDAFTCVEDLIPRAESLAAIPIGFAEPPVPGPHQIVEVSSDILVMESDSGERVQLDWVGHTLEGCFFEGESMEVSQSEGWHSATNRGFGFSAHAFVLRGGTLLESGEVPMLPFFEPEAMRLVPQCMGDRAAECPHEGHTHALEVTMYGRTTRLLPGEEVELGTNVVHFHDGLELHHFTCAPAEGTYAVITVLIETVCIC